MVINEPGKWTKLAMWDSPKQLSVNMGQRYTIRAHVVIATARP